MKAKGSTEVLEVEYRCSIQQRFWRWNIGALHSRRDQLAHNGLCPTGTAFLLIEGSELTNWPQIIFSSNVKIFSSIFLPIIPMLKTESQCPQKKQPWQSTGQNQVKASSTAKCYTALTQLSREKGLEWKYISYNRTLMFSTTNKRWDGSIWRLYHSVDSLCEYLFFTILEMIIIIKVSSQNNTEGKMMLGMTLLFSWCQRNLQLSQSSSQMYAIILVHFKTGD